jgi:hypothetical protein
MIGSPLIGAWIALLTFWVLMALGVGSGALSRKAVGVFVVLWLAGSIGVPRIAWWMGPMATSYVAVLDIVLVFIVFKGDVRIT